MKEVRLKKQKENEQVEKEKYEKNRQILKRIYEKQRRMKEKGRDEGYSNERLVEKAKKKYGEIALNKHAQISPHEKNNKKITWQALGNLSYKDLQGKGEDEFNIKHLLVDDEDDEEETQALSQFRGKKKPQQFVHQSHHLVQYAPQEPYPK